MNDPLNEREFELVNIIGGQLAANQRQLSRQMNLSLGMTNLILRRLINKGYIRIHQLNKKKTEYLLTPKGFSEKMRKSIKYTIKTITSIGLIKKCFKEILSGHYDRGERIFYILGESDFAFLIEVVSKEQHWTDAKFIYIKSVGEAGPDGVLCICKEGVDAPPESQKYINFIKELAQDEELAEHSRKE